MLLLGCELPVVMTLSTRSLFTLSILTAEMISYFFMITNMPKVAITVCVESLLRRIVNFVSTVDLFSSFTTLRSIYHLQTRSENKKLWAGDSGLLNFCAGFEKLWGCMQTSTLTTFVRLIRWTRQGHSHHVRYMSRYAEAAVYSSRPFVGPEPTFESAGIRPSIASALRLAFPNVKYPTKAQNEFIPAILRGKDVLLKDATGTGKYAIFCLLV